MYKLWWNLKWCWFVFYQILKGPLVATLCLWEQSVTPYFFTFFSFIEQMQVLTNNSWFFLTFLKSRTMEQYLINHSPLSKSPGSPPEELSLKSILEGRRRKLCRRMFYEILVSLQIPLRMQHAPLGMWVYKCPFFVEGAAISSRSLCCRLYMKYCCF